MSSKKKGPESGTILSVPAEFCPQALIDWYKLGYRSNQRNEASKSEAKEKAKKHLSAMGWVFWQTFLKGKKRNEMRYTSPSGKCYNSLRTACKGFLDERGISGSVENSLVPVKINDVGQEYLVRENSDLVQKKELSPINDNGGVSESVEDCLVAVKINYSAPENSTPEIRRSGRKRKNSDFIQYKESDDDHDDGSGVTDDFTDKKDQPGVLDLHQNPQNPSFADSKKTVEDGEKIIIIRRKKVRKTGNLTSSPYRNPRSVLSWLIDNNLLVPRAKVYYRPKKGCLPPATGLVTRNGIECDCCSKLFTLTGFEAHAGCTNHRPAANIILEDGRSLLDCQKQMKNKKESKKITNGYRRKEKGCSISKPNVDQNDEICSVCHYGGEIVLCDGCPSSFHSHCLGLEGVPDGDWFCPLCRCGTCGFGKLEQACEEDASFVVCQQCERKHHIGCLKGGGDFNFDQSHSKHNWFCSGECESVYLGLRAILGKPIFVGDDNLTWMLLKYTDSSHSCGDNSPVEALTEDYSKLNIAVSVIHECFDPIIDRFTGKDIVEDVVFGRESEVRRLNFKGFYTVVLERNDELITVATVRIYGNKLAELPLVGTRFQYRRLGMCRVLMNELEKQLGNIGVERMTLPAVHNVLETWTGSFGFSKMTDAERLELISYNLLDFQDTFMCQKKLKKSETKPSSSEGNLCSVNVNYCMDISTISPLGKEHGGIMT